MNKNKQIINQTIDYLLLLRQVYTDDAMPPMIDESNNEERIEKINLIIKQLKQLKKSL